MNTCAIRDHAEQRVLGNLGALVHVKRGHPDQIICVCGCMAQEQHVADKIKQSFRHVDLVFGPHVLWKFPEFIHTLLTSRGRIFQIPDEAGSIAEGIPVVRQDKVKAWVSIAAEREPHAGLDEVHAGLLRPDDDYLARCADRRSAHWAVSYTHLDVYKRQRRDSPPSAHRSSSSVSSVMWVDRKSTRLNSSHVTRSRMPSSA